MRFHRDGFMELGESVIDLVEHHHAVAPVGIVLSILFVEADGSPKVIHGLLVVPNRHKSLPPFRVVLGVS